MEDGMIDQKLFLAHAAIEATKKLGVAGIGFDSLVVDKVTEKEKKLLNKLAYVWHGTEIMRKEFLFNNWRYRFQVRFDDEEQWYDATSVIVGKSRYYAGRYNLFNGASLSSPLLHAALFTGDKRGDFIRQALLQNSLHCSVLPFFSLHG